MGIKEFFSQTPPDEGLREAYLDAENPLNSGTRLNAFLQDLGNACRQEILKLTPLRDYAAQNELDPEEIKLFLKEHPEEFGGIFLASFIPSIGEMIADGKVSLGPFASRANMYLQGTVMPAINIADQITVEEEISSKAYANIIENAQKDKTLAVFIRVPKLLPPKVSTFLNKGNLLHFMKLVVEEYEARARIIVAEPDSQLPLSV